jgi:hypothetical protein
VIEHRSAQIDGRFVRHQMMVHGIASGVCASGDQDDITDLEGAHLLLGERRAQHHFASGALETVLIGHRDDGDRFVAIDPVLDRAGARVEHDTETPERPAVVGDGNEEARGRRFCAVILQPMSDTRPPNPIVPMPSLLTSPMIDASSSASRGSAFTSSSVRNNCSFAA